MRTKVLLGTLACFSFWVACGGTGGTQADDLTGSAGGASGSGGTSTGKGGASGKAGATSTGKGGASAGAAGAATGGTTAAGAGGGAAGKAGASGAAAGGAAGASGAAGAGGLTCAANTADCNGNAADKCEIHTDLDPNNCGACGKKCPTAPSSVATCVAGACGTQCQPGYTDCDKNAPGCETATGMDPNNCGACGKVCPAGGGAKASCAAGTCVLSCAANTGDCNKNAMDGCEASFQTDPKNCGACGMDCGGGSCVSGACQCAGETQTAKKLPLDMYIMMDQSGSMSDTTSNGMTKWDNVKAALAGFVADPNAAGLGVGIGFFGVPAGGGGGPPSSCNTNNDCIVGGVDYGPCFGALPPIFPGTCLGGSAGGDSCSAADYAKPSVEIATLPGVGAAINSAMGSHGPTTSTPTAPALQGALDHAKAWAQAHPDHVVIAVLATDGDPTECTPQDIPGIAAIASSYLNGTPKIRTFVIGVGTSTANLDGIATGGGTAPAFIVDTNANVVTQFEAALAAIQGTALGCQYVIPKPMSGMLDFTKVNVQYTPGNGGSPVVIPNVANAAACTASGGWYYDVPTAPTQILLCPSTCTTVSADTKGTVSVQLGCATKKI